MGNMSERLLRYATDKDRMYFEAIEEHGTHEAAGKALGVHRSTVSKAMKRLHMRAAKGGWSPDHDMTHEAAPGFMVKGTSTYYDRDGKPTGQWVKTKFDGNAEYDKWVLDAVECVTDNIRGLSPDIKAPVYCDKDTLTFYPIPDVHIGMYASLQECGIAYNREIAESLITKSLQRAVQCAPQSERAIIGNLGDFTHVDNNTCRTNKSNNPLDVDGRYHEILETGVRAMRTVIDMALQKHLYVKVINAIGNHDQNTSTILSIALSGFYENNPRVEVITDTTPFHYHKFGNTLLGITHGDAGKREMYGQYMARDVPEWWGDTKYRYFYTAHKHSQSVLEVPGCIIESFNALAPPDSWTASMGYRSQRSVSSIVLHRKFGEVERSSHNINQMFSCKPRGESNPLL